MSDFWMFQRTVTLILTTLIFNGPNMSLSHPGRDWSGCFICKKQVNNLTVVTGESCRPNPMSLTNSCVFFPSRSLLSPTGEVENVSLF